MNRNFKRDLGQLREVFSFLDTFADGEGIGTPTILPMRLAVEELFTNMVRHNAASRSDISISLSCVNDSLTAVLTDLDVAEPFDPTKHTEVDTTAKLDDREAGGLGIHLVKRMVDEIHYHYSATNRRSQITLIKSINSRHA
jgi:anti-sigma regulatory factor (Ser/Thr protein kinase)